MLAKFGFNLKLSELGMLFTLAMYPLRIAFLSSYAFHV